MSTKHIAVVCAQPGSPNTGMFTVDRAAHRFFATRFPQARASFHALGETRRHPFRATLPFALASLPESLPQVLAADAIVFWGDFLQARNYWPALARRLAAAGLCADEAAALDTIYRVLMLEGAPDAVLAKAVLFGSTLITNTGADLTESRYAQALARLCGGARAVLLRDPLSTAQVSGPPILGKNVAQGCDAALLPDREIRMRGAAEDASAELGVFFGRASLTEAFRYHWLAGRVARRLRLRPRWIPWLRIPLRARRLARLFGRRETQLAPTPLEAIVALERARFVVTDTYHLTLNAWRRGVPAVCLSRRDDASLDARTDRKKEVAYRMLGAEAFLVHGEALSSWSGVRRETARVAAVVESGDAARAVAAKVERLGAEVEARLAAAVRGLVG